MVVVVDMEEEVVAAEEEEVGEAGVEVEEAVAAVEDVVTEEEGQVDVVVVDEVAMTGKIHAFFSQVLLHKIYL